MNAQIKIYEDIGLFYFNNFIVEHMEIFLSQFATDNPTSVITKENQLIKHALDVSIKVDLSSTDFNTQDYMPFVAGNFQYVVARNKKGEDFVDLPIYYYVMEKKWLSENTIELKLKMDVLNTFFNTMWDGDLHFDKRTTILREHKDRWVDISSYGDIAYPNIDLYSEGIQPALFKTAEFPLWTYNGTDYDVGSYYLIYRSRTEDENSPIDVFLCADNPIEVDFSIADGYTGTITWNDLTNKDGSYGLLIYGDDLTSNVGASVKFKHYTTRTEYEEITLTISNSSKAIICFPDRVYFGWVDLLGFHYEVMYGYNKHANIQFEEFEVKNVKVAHEVLWTTGATTLLKNYIINLPKVAKIRDAEAEQGFVAPISAIDRTDPKLLKIIKLPYKPVNFTLTSQGKMTKFPDGWIFEHDIANFPTLLKYDTSDLTKCLNNTIFLYTGDNSYKNATDIVSYHTLNGIGKITNRNDENETKIWHSDYFIQKFVYDSFAYTYRLELFKKGFVSPLNYTPINFKVSLTMSSKFMFEFVNLQIEMQYDTQDYSALLYVARNNELPIFNSAYLNYIRTGYNYDIKTRNRQLTSNIIGGTLATAGAVASFLSSIWTGGIGITAGVGLATTALGQFTRTALDTAQADQNIAEKLKQAEMQGLSVAGADDVDLMTEYTTQNKAKLIKYEASPRMKKVLCDLFYYCGYVANYQGIPNFKSRLWFNFLQANVILKDVPKIPDYVIDEITSKFKEGATFFHMNGIRGNYLWDLRQQYENWEVSLLENYGGN